MEVGLTIKFQYSLDGLFISQDERDNALACLYNACMRRMKARGMRIVDFVYEKDSKGLLHVHAHARLDKKLYNSYCQAWIDRYETFGIKGYSIKIEHAKNLPGWKKYMLKDVNAPGKYFKQGVWPSPAKESNMAQHASDVYDYCIRREMEALEKLLGGLAVVKDQAPVQLTGAEREVIAKFL